MTRVHVTFLCPTYGRAPDELHLLNEKVYWFTRQEYPAESRELLVFNDCAWQTLTCDVPGVRVVNYPHRFRTLGDKMNAMIAVARPGVAVVDEDDDISLPGRADQSARYLAGGPGKPFDYFDPLARWYQPGPSAPLVYDNKNCTHHAAAYRVGAVVYPPTSHAHDQAVQGWLRLQESAGRARCWWGQAGNSPHGLPADACEMVYRWGVSKFHLSSQSKMDAAYAAVRSPASGTYRIEPVMGRDYAAEVAAVLKGSV